MEESTRPAVLKHRPKAFIMLSPSSRQESRKPARRRALPNIVRIRCFLISSDAMVRQVPVPSRSTHRPTHIIVTL